MDAHDDTDFPTIVVRVETKSVVPAATAGSILDEVARGFERHARAEGRRDLRLGIHRVDIGSLIINLIVIGSVSRLPRPDDVAQSFVVATGKLLRVEQGIDPGAVKRTDARLVDALRKPVADGVADRVVLSSRDAVEEVAVDVAVVGRIDQARSRQTEPTTRAIKTDAGKQAAMPRLRELLGKQGTVLDVKGRWYVRLEGAGGVLNPLEPGPGIAVQDEGVYLFDGSWEGRRYRIRAARRIA